MPAVTPALDARRLYFRLLGYLWPYWRVFAVSLLGMVVAAATEPAFARLMKPLVDGNFARQGQSDLWHVPLWIVTVFVVRGLTSYVNEYSMAWLAGKLVQDLREAMFRQLLCLPVSFYDQSPTGVLLSKVAYDVNQVTQAGANIITVTVKDSLTVLGLLGLLLYTDWQLTLVCIAILPLVGLLIRWASRRLRGLSRDGQQAMGELTQILEEAISCQRVVKIYGGQTQEQTRFAQATNRLRQLNVKQTAASSGNSAVVQLLIACALAIIVYFASQRAANGQLTAGDFMSFMTAMLMLFAPIKRLTSVNESLQKGLAAAESVFSLLDEVPEHDLGQMTLPRAVGDLRFEQVSFHYPQSERAALTGINLHIQAGETVALVGGSGGGKTTLAQLIPRFYNPSHGIIYLDNQPLDHFTLTDLRAQIALVSQDITLFNASVAANIAYGARQRASLADIEAACIAAHALEFIHELPQGLETVIGDNGVRLSGGQRQRLAIARALLKDAPILILDEATSALDSASERQVQAALERLMHGRTTLVIAHRLSTIEKADRILVLQGGQILEAGDHAQLLTRQGAYARLHQLQFVSPGTP